MTVPYRTPLFDPAGRMTREWIQYFEGITAGVTSITNIENVTVNQGQASAFDDVPQVDVSGAIVNALLQLGDTPAPPVQDAGAGVDWSAAQAPADPLASILLADTPVPSPAPLDLSALLSDNSPLGNGVSGAITIPKLTTANGSITVVNGVITGFVNPT